MNSEDWRVRCMYQQGPVYACARVDTCSRLHFIQQNENKIEHGYMVHLSWKSCYTIPAQFRKTTKHHLSETE